MVFFLSQPKLKLKNKNLEKLRDGLLSALSVQILSSIKVGTLFLPLNLELHNILRKP